MAVRALVWLILVMVGRQASSELYNPFPQNQDQPCCGTCKNEQYSSENQCTTWSSAYPVRGIQWFLIGSDGTYNLITGVLPKNTPANHDGYSAPCRLCPPGWFRSPTTCLCVKCQGTSCPTGQYADPTCSQTTDLRCSPCSSCGTGKQTSQPCQLGFNTVCRECPGGTYRDQDAVNAGSMCLPCLTCLTSLRQARSGCTASINEKCPQCPEGSIVTLGQTTDTCKACATGEYAKASENKCVTCTTCDRTQRVGTECALGADRVCVACTDNRRSKTVNGNCDGCARDYYLTGVGTCALCTGRSCGDGSYRLCTYTDEKGGEQTCGFCQGQKESTETNVCSAGKGVSVRCNGQGSVAVVCSECGPGTERPDGTALVGDIQQCISCGTGYYKLAMGTSPCTVCTNKPPIITQYISWGSELPIKADCPW